MTKDSIAPDTVWQEYEAGRAFKRQLNLYETVRNNENFYVGKQWEGVQANGLPTPVFNFIRRIVLFLVASTATDNLKINASPLSAGGSGSAQDLERLCAVVNAQLEATAEDNRLGKLTRELARNAAVDGDGCLYAWFDPQADTGQEARGSLRRAISFL